MKSTDHYAEALRLEALAAQARDEFYSPDGGEGPPTAIQAAAANLTAAALVHAKLAEVALDYEARVAYRTTGTWVHPDGRRFANDQLAMNAGATWDRADPDTLIIDGVSLEWVEWSEPANEFARALALPLTGSDA